MPFAQQTNAQAVNAPASNPPLHVEISTSKNSYTLLSKITYSVAVTNTSTATVNNVSAEALFGNDITPLTGSQIKAEKTSLAPGETLRFSYNAQLKSFKALDILLLPLKWIFASGSTMPITDNGFNDGREYTEASTRANLMSLFNSTYNTTSTARVWYGSSAINDSMEFSKAVAQMVKDATPASGVDISAAADNEYYSKRVIVRSSANINLDTFNAIGVIKGPDGVSALQFANEADAKKCLDQLNAISQVQYAEMDRYVSTCFTSEAEAMHPEVKASDISAQAATYYSWGVKHIEADKYSDWLASQGYNSIVRVAVVDSGVSSHTFLSGKILSGYNFVDNNNNPADTNGHGTHVAGTVVDCTQPLNVRIMPVRVLGTNGSGSWSNVANGIRYAADNGAHVINLSLGGPGCSQQIDDAIAYAIGKGVTVVIAAGNDNRNTSGFCPAHIMNAIVVSAIDSTNTKASFSNFGAAVDVAAPGVNINSCDYRGGFVSFNGTSMAAPHIAAVAAMCKLRNPSATPAQIEQMIKNSAKPLPSGSSGRNDQYGNGIPQLSYFIPVTQTYTVSYNANGGSNPPASQTKQHDVALTLSNNRPTPPTSNTVVFDFIYNGDERVDAFTIESSASFNNWNSNQNGSGTTYSSGSSYTENASRTLYAQWAWSNRTITLPSPGNRNGHQFNGWYSGLDFVGNVGDSYTVTSGAKLNAAWLRLFYLIGFDPMGGTIDGWPGTTVTMCYPGSSITMPTPTRPGYSFAGWYTLGGTRVGGGGSSYTPTGGITNMIPDVTLYARWS